eukprot:3900969-Prymnesium_polylepis.1
MYPTFCIGGVVCVCVCRAPNLEAVLSQRRAAGGAVGPSGWGVGAEPGGAVKVSRQFVAKTQVVILVLGGIMRERLGPALAEPGCRDFK